MSLMSLQVVYVLTNPAMPGFVKIGKTLLEDVSLAGIQMDDLGGHKLFAIVQEALALGLAVHGKDAVGVAQPDHRHCAFPRVQFDSDIGPKLTKQALNQVNSKTRRGSVARQLRRQGRIFE